MNSPNAEGILFLSKVSYNEERREIIAEFENGSRKAVERFKFFPKAFCSIEGKDRALVEEVLGLYDRKRFLLSSPREGMLEIKASTMKDLKKISRILEKSFRQGLQIIEAERQFLIEKEWDYLGAFAAGKFGMEKARLAEGFPKVIVAGFSESLERTARQLLEFDRNEAMQFMEKAALSNALKLPLGAVPESAKESAAVFLENMLFRNSFVLEKERGKKAAAEAQGVEGYFENVSEIDFTPVWAGMICDDGKNIGFETMNCKCCIPKEIGDANVLPNSMIETEFLQNGSYFESEDNAFAERLHSEMPNRKARIERMKEWFLQKIPLGPFAAGERIEMPLADAERLVKAGKARICSMEKAEWYCIRKESFLARELRTLILEITRFEDKMLGLEHSALREHKVLCSSQLGESLEYLLAFYARKAREELLREALREISNCSGRKAAKALKALQILKISEFNALAKESGEKVLQSGGNGFLLLKAERPMGLLKKFSARSESRLPAVLKNHKGIVLN